MGKNQSKFQLAASSQNQNKAVEDELNDNRVTAAAVNLPSDLIYEILCRVPAKSVGRFRCVSKDWQILLSSPKFLKNQFIFNKHQTKIIVDRNDKIFSINIRNDCSNNEGHPVAISEALHVKSNLKIRGSCNGLILFYDYETSQLSIVNPITRESRQLPPIPECIGREPNVFGFGYYVNDDEYTVIIESHRTPGPVCMLKSNLWKRVEDSPRQLRGSGAFVNGCLHWVGKGDLGYSHVVCAFDLASEKFREVEKPVGFKKECWFSVNVLGGCLCLVCDRNSTHDICDIWVMKKYGLRDSWIKYVACATYSWGNYRFHPFFFWKGDESIVAANEERLILYCLKQKTSSTIPFIGEQCSIISCYSYTFVDSLFSPNSSNALEGPNQVQV